MKNSSVNNNSILILTSLPNCIGSHFLKNPSYTHVVFAMPLLQIYGFPVLVSYTNHILEIYNKSTADILKIAIEMQSHPASIWAAVQSNYPNLIVGAESLLETKNLIKNTSSITKAFSDFKSFYFS